MRACVWCRQEALAPAGSPCPFPICTMYQVGREHTRHWGQGWETGQESKAVTLLSSGDLRQIASPSMYWSG